MDGVDIQKYNIDHYRNLFSVLNQEFYLFADDLESNILMGRTFDEKYLNDLIEKIYINNDGRKIKLVFKYEDAFKLAMDYLKIVKEGGNTNA